MLQPPPNPEYFYPLPMVPVSNEDWILLRHKEGARGCSHLLVAMIWQCEEDGAGWKVAVYPMREQQAYWELGPLYESAGPLELEVAWQLSRSMRRQAVRGRLLEELRRVKSADNQATGAEEKQA